MGPHLAEVGWRNAFSVGPRVHHLLKSTTSLADYLTQPVFTYSVRYSGLGLGQLPFVTEVQLGVHLA